MSYIGQTNNIKRRMCSHFSDFNRKTHISLAIKKYGKENFILEILVEAEIEKLDVLEIESIKEHKTLTPNGYNLTGGGQGKKILSQHTRDLWSKIRTGKPRSKESIEKQRNTMTGKKNSPEHIAKVAEKRRRPIKVINLDINQTLYFDSLKSAEILGFKKALIHKALNRLNNRLKNYQFFYTSKDEYNSFIQGIN